MGDLRGTYFYADYCATLIRSFRTEATCAVFAPIERKADLAPEGGQSLALLNSFGDDARGEIYIVARLAGVFKIVPALDIVEVSGRNAAPFLAGNPDWTWEDLFATSWRPITSYKVYRAGTPTGTFSCVRQSASNQWPGGDPQSPAPGAAFFYLVTALNPAGDEARPGNASDGTPRSVNTLSVCPP
jgi:hypothetical protein